MRKNVSMILALVFLLSGCATPPQPDLTLDQRLAGKNKSEQRAILKDLCLQEVQRRPFDLLTGHFYKERPDVPLLEQVCNKMAQEMSPCDIVVH
ncbi:MAG: hypothetical protein HY052_01135 [Proteobacteria bacterium]|nr:hypothetical protein [Pseudomonadota bacterium]